MGDRRAHVEVLTILACRFARRGHDIGASTGQCYSSADRGMRRGGIKPRTTLGILVKFRQRNKELLTYSLGFRSHGESESLRFLMA